MGSTATQAGRSPDRDAVVFRTRLHPVRVSWNLGFSLLVFGVAALVVHRNDLSIQTVAILWLSAAGIVALASLPSFVRWRLSGFAVTGRDLVVRLGLRTRRAIPLAAIAQVRVERGWLGGLLGYGTVEVVVDGEAEVFPGVARPEELRQAVLRQARHAGGRRAG